MQRAMEDLGMTSAEIMDIFRIMAAILKLGNVNFIPTTNMDGTEGCAISNDYGEIFSWEHDQEGGLSIYTLERPWSPFYFVQILPFQNRFHSKILL